ncbi:hypothetical protein LTR50_006450 [Elasticomyces elasticus]|nr:hypothetical protein LTR50_006450 [Elasticomyces elasticus]
MRLPPALFALPSSLLLPLTLALLPLVSSTSAPGNHTITTHLPDGLTLTTSNLQTCDRRTRAGDTISVHYIGTLQSTGAEFDESYRRGMPFTFVLGKGQVIRGWDEGLEGLCVGELRRLVVPPDLAYGSGGVGMIPGGATLVFDTELIEIEGVPLPTKSASAQETGMPATKVEPTLPTSDETSASTTGSDTFTIATAPANPVPIPETEADHHGKQGDHAKQGDQGAENGECRLLGPFALVVQGALGALALLALVFKRWRERPRRPVKIWFFDVSKQVMGSVLLHIANLFMSMFSSGALDMAAKAKGFGMSIQDGEGRTPNPCSFYLLNLAIDTTIGIPILVVLLRIFHSLFLYTPIANPPESIRSGNYGQPHSSPKVTWWLKQSLIYFLGLFGMKLCVFFIFQILPWIAWVGDWALRWTEGNEALQIAFVMFLFPLTMNAIQYYIIDGFIKEKSGQDEGFQQIPTEEDEEEEEDDNDESARGDARGASRNSANPDADTNGEERKNGKKTVRKIRTKEILAEANPTPVPQYDEQVDGEASSGSKTPAERVEDKHDSDKRSRRRSQSRSRSRSRNRNP